MAEWVFCRHTHLDKWWPRVLKWFPVGVVDGTGHPSPLRGFSSLTAQHPVRFGTTGFLAPTQSNCRVDTMFLDQAASDDRRRERRSRGDPDWSLPMGIGVYGRMLAGPSTSSFKRVGENTDPMVYRGCLSPSGCASGMEGRWKVDEGEEGLEFGGPCCVLPDSAEPPNLQRGSTCSPSAGTGERRRKPSPFHCM